MRNTRPSKEAGSRRPRSPGERAEVLARYVASELTQRVFAQGEGIGVSTLQLWLRQGRVPAAPAEPARSRAKRAEPPAACSFLEVELAGGVERAGALTMPYELVLARGTRLRLAHGFTASEVRLLLALLREES